MKFTGSNSFSEASLCLRPMLKKLALSSQEMSTPSNENAMKECVARKTSLREELPYFKW